MKTIALTVALILQVTGLWSHLPAEKRARLADASITSPQPAARPVAAISTLALPVRIGNEPLKFNQTTSILALDRASGTQLYAQNEAQKRPIASITKVVTTLVVLSRHQPSELVKIPTLPSYGPEDDIIGLVPGETYRLGDLVKAALIPSANDAADALALYDSGSIPGFTAKMNAKASDWGITDTHFASPSGLQDTGNYASAAALAKFGLLALENPFIREAVKQTNTSLTSTNGRTLSRTTTNDLLSTSKFYGIKTGYTLAAGECFMGLTQINGHDVITVVLGSSDRFGNTQTLVTWIGRNYQWL